MGVWSDRETHDRIFSDRVSGGGLSTTIPTAISSRFQVALDKENGLLQKLKEAFMMALTLFGAATTSLVAVVFFESVRRIPNSKLEMYQVDVSHKEPMVYMSSYIYDYRYTMLQIVTFDSIFFYYFVLAIGVYLTLTWTQLIKLGSSTTIGFVLFYLLKLSTTSSMVLQLSGLFPPILTFLTLKWMMGSEFSLVYPIVAQILFFYFGGGVFMFLWNKLSIYGVKNQILTNCVLVPISKELASLLARVTAQALTLPELGPGAKFKVKRTAAWLFLFPAQILFAMFTRLVLVRIDDGLVFSLVVIYQSLMELFMRFTMPQRVAIVNDFAEWFQKRTRKIIPAEMVSQNWIGSAVEEEEEGQETESDGTEDKNAIAATTYLPHQRREVILKRWCAMIILSELISEYVGIWAMPVLILMNRNSRLLVPYDYYSNFQFDESIDVTGLIKFSMGLILSEIVVDTLCILIEEQRGYSLSYIWNRKTKRFYPILLLATWYGTACLHMFFTFRDLFTKECLDRDMCYCTSAGLQKGGLRYSYCQYLYPDTNGLPAK